MTQSFPLSLPQRILLLGSGELGKELTISLQRLGCSVVACDTYAGAPAMGVASEARVVDMTDEEAVSALIAEVRPDVVVPEVEKLAVGALVDAAANGTRVVPSARIVELTFDRQGIRTLAAEKAKVPTSPYAFASSLDEVRAAADKLGFPCYIKPTMSSSGHGQSRVTSADQLEAAWNEALSGARADTGRVIIEGEVPFDYEITLLTVRSLEGDEVVTSFCQPIGHRQEHGDYVESWQPQLMSDELVRKAQKVAQAVTDELAADSVAEGNPVLGIFGVELFVRGDEVYFSELSPRPHDTGLVTLLSQRQSEFDLHARAILGLPVSTAMAVPAAASAPFKSPIESESPCYAGAGEVLADPAVTLRVFGKPVAHVGRRMAVAVAEASDVETARARARKAISELRMS
ncbi:formate-dependent phosphoribosylglycinamide formyltransferase [Arcanobacterium haemolyticum]|nr:formate-dependent phosphoribosylglycinamide formyltransferase [Arcanobacterium haemolyticum]